MHTEDTSYTCALIWTLNLASVVWLKIPFPQESTCNHPEVGRIRGKHVKYIMLHSKIIFYLLHDGYKHSILSRSELSPKYHVDAC